MKSISRKIPGQAPRERRGGLQSSRRAFLGVSGGAALASTLFARPQGPGPAAPRDWSGGSPLPYPDPDILTLDPRFRPYIVFNTPIRRLHTGTLWAEGPAWSGTGQYLVWSDIPQNLQHRWIEDDGRVTTFRKPSGFSNGNTFDYQGRQLSAEHGGRRVVRYETDGSVTIIAERYNGSRLNSPNDVVAHPDGSVWFTDPIYGIAGNYEGYQAQSETPEAVYRVDPVTFEVRRVTDEVTQPNGLCFSADYSRLYVADTGQREIHVWDVNGGSLTGHTRFAASGADGIRCDVDGNIWAATGTGVDIIAPDGATIGRIRLPEICANVCFGGQRRNRLFMTASQSLYAVYVGTLGAHIA